MTRRLLSVATIVFLVLCGTSAKGQLSSADHPVFGAGSLTLDAATGLAWLDVTLSGTRSFNDMTGVDGSNEFATGGAFASFRYATMAEVGQLWVNAGIPESAFFYGIDPVTLMNIGTFQTNDASIFANARALQTLMGNELTVANPPHVNAGGWVTSGLALGVDGIGLPRLDTCTVGTGFCGGSSIPITRAHIGSTNPTFWQPVVGQHHWLVMAGAVAPIPEPETYALLLAGLGLLGFAARRRLK